MKRKTYFKKGVTRILPSKIKKEIDETKKRKLFFRKEGSLFLNKITDIKKWGEKDTHIIIKKKIKSFVLEKVISPLPRLLPIIIISAIIFATFLLNKDFGLPCSSMPLFAQLATTTARLLCPI